MLCRPSRIAASDAGRHRRQECLHGSLEIEIVVQPLDR
jgi:hypothetical protein